MTRIRKVIAGFGVVASFAVALLPLSSYAANPENVTVSIKIEPTLSALSVCSQVGDIVTGITAGASGEATCTVTYSSNGSTVITIANKDADTDLRGDQNQSNRIPTLSTSANLASISASSTAAWGYKFAVTTAGAGSGGLTAANANVGLYNGLAVSTAPVRVGSNIGVVTNAVGTFTFGVKTLINTPADVYEDTVVIAVTAGV